MHAGGDETDTQLCQDLGSAVEAGLSHKESEVPRTSLQVTTDRMRRRWWSIAMLWSRPRLATSAILGL